MHIGDPTFAGWLIFFVYLAVVYRCYLQYVKVKFGFLDHNFWLVIGLFLLLLCINKQLDLQTVFEASMKELAQSHGWYAQRKMMQVTFVALLSISLLTGLVVLRSVLAKACRQHKAVCLGVLLLCIFIVLRAAAFNHLSFLNTRTYWGFNAHSLLELIALCVMFYGTFTLKSGTSYSGKRHSATPHFADKKTQTQSAAIAYCAENGDDVHCPNCNKQATAKAAHGRQFKCKACAAFYTVRIQ